LEDLSDDIDEDIELDVIALCCDFVESTLNVALQDTGCDSLEDLRDNTTVIMVREGEEEDGSDTVIIYQSF
jgi:hypothetical protein